MKWVEAIERLSELIPDVLLWGTFAAWLSIVPLFWIIGPPSEPVGNDSCRYWKDCVENSESVRPVTGPNKESDKYSPAQE